MQIQSILFSGRKCQFVQGYQDYIQLKYYQSYNNYHIKAMNRNVNHRKGPSHTEEEIVDPNGIYGNADMIEQDQIAIQKIESQQKVGGGQLPQNPYIVGQNGINNNNHLQPNPYNTQNQVNDVSAQINKQTYLNGVAMNLGNQPTGPHNYGNQPHNNFGPPHPNQNYQPNPNPVAIQNNQQVFINGAPQTVVIVNENPRPAVKQDYWQRPQRVGCCCISMHNTSCCCDYYCVNSCCRLLQGRNLCCYCYGMDCVHCCAHHACRTCCLQKELCECMLECCKHMPLCLLIDCLKDSKCCECLIDCCQNVNICECIQGCDCNCVGQACEGICNIICCFFK